ncbi:MAG: tetratricopeptide repeat protein [Candidatus Binatia bacterium]
MIPDRYGGAHTTTSQLAVSSFERAVAAVGAHRPAGEPLQNSLSFDEGLISAHALLGFANVILARAETAILGANLSTLATRLLRERGGGTASERALVGALTFAAGGHLKAAADLLESHLEECPANFVALKIAHSLRFMSGQPAKMLALTRRVLPHWSAADSAYGFVLGCHAFGLEEMGYFSEAEVCGRDAYRQEHSDAWGLHAVSHVMEMSNRTDEGIDWLEASRADWSSCNNFAFHIGWHLALFHLERGNVPAVLSVYDRDVRSTPTDDFRDMANAASLLWRLEQEGVDVGERWIELHDIAFKRRTDTTYVFGSLHYLLVLVARGDKGGVAELLEALKERARLGSDDQSDIAARIGLPLAAVITGTDGPALSMGDITQTAALLQGIGGSHAQRDVFLRTLLLSASRSGNTASVVALSRVRHYLRSSDRFIRMIDRHCGQTSAVRTSLRISKELAL